MRRLNHTAPKLAIMLLLTLPACPNAKDGETGKDDGARESVTGTEGGEPKPQV